MRSSGISRTAVGVRAASRLMRRGSVSLSCWKMRTPASRNDFLSKCRHLPRELEEAFRGVRARVVLGDGDARGRRLPQLDPLSDHRVEDVVVAELAQRLQHL